MHRHLRRAAHGNRGETERFDGRPQAGAVAGDDERPGGEHRVSLLELFFGRLHFQIFQAIAQRDHVVRSVVRHRERRSGAGYRARDRQHGHGIDGHVEQGLVRDLPHVCVTHQPYRPRRVVVRAKIRIGEHLLLEQNLGEPCVRLIALDDEGAGRERAFFQLHLRCGLADFDTLHPQKVDRDRDARHVALAGGNEVSRHRFPAARLDRVARLHVEVFEDHFRELRRVLKRRQHARFAVVGVVAKRPVEVAGRGPRTEPLALTLIAASRGDRRRVRLRSATAAVTQSEFLSVRAAEPLNLVHADHAVVVRRHEREIAGRPHVDVAVRPHAGHAVLRHLRHLEVRHHRQLAEEDRIEIRILRRLAAEGVEQRLRLMQVVHDRRVPLQIPVEQRPHAHLRVVDVAVVVVEDVLAPVRHADLGIAGRLLRSV